MRVGWMRDFEFKQVEPRHTRTHMTAHTQLSFFRSVNLTPDAQIRTGQSTEVTVDGKRDSGVVDWTRTKHTSFSQKMVERLRELSADL